MPDAAEYRRAWDADNTVPFPRELWMSTFPLPAEVYPPVDFLPMDLSVVYTSYLTGGEAELYDQIDLKPDEGRASTYMLIGAVPADKDMWFLFDTATGAVQLLDIREPSLERVNTTLAHFVEFLYHFATFIDTDEGLADRATRATRLHATLVNLDPAAFAEEDSWWSAVFMALGVE